MLNDAAPRRGGRALLPGLLALALALVLGAGCSPDDFLMGDDERDRNLQRARDSERLGEFDAAAEYYERALERSSRSPAVHLGYASLCESQLRRYPDAVYHYQRYLRLLAPGDAKAEDIRRRITNCTERLATSVPLVIRSETIARDLQAVRNENLSLRAQLTNVTAATLRWSNECQRLTAAVVQLQGQVLSQSQALAFAQSQAQAQAQAQARMAGSTAGGGGGAAAAGGRPAGAVRPLSGGVGTAVVVPDPGSTRSGVHRVLPGETLDRIARQHGVSLRALQQANPRVEPRRMRPGTDLRIPGR